MNVDSSPSEIPCKFAELDRKSIQMDGSTETSSSTVIVSLDRLGDVDSIITGTFSGKTPIGVPLGS